MVGEGSFLLCCSESPNSKSASNRPSSRQARLPPAGRSPGRCQGARTTSSLPVLVALCRNQFNSPRHCSQSGSRRTSWVIAKSLFSWLGFEVRHHRIGVPNTTSMRRSPRVFFRLWSNHLLGKENCVRARFGASQILLHSEDAQRVPCPLRMTIRDTLPDAHCDHLMRFSRRARELEGPLRDINHAWNSPSAS